MGRRACRIRQHLSIIVPGPPCTSALRLSYVCFLCCCNFSRAITTDDYMLQVLFVNCICRTFFGMKIAVRSVIGASVCLVWGPSLTVSLLGSRSQEEKASFRLLFDRYSKDTTVIMVVVTYIINFLLGTYPIRSSVHLSEANTSCTLKQHTFAGPTSLIMKSVTLGKIKGVTSVQKQPWHLILERDV